MIHVDSPRLLLVALALVLLTIVIGTIRRIRIPRAAQVCILVGLICLALAASGIRINLEHPTYVAVMVDVSPSTRTAAFRDGGLLARRVPQLLNGQAFRMFHFASGAKPASLDDQPREMLAETTTLITPDGAGAMLVFSDGQFEVPDARLPPTFVVIDSQLEQTDDGRVVQLEHRETEFVATVHVLRGERQLTFSGSDHPHRIRGSMVVGHTASADLMTAKLDAADAWPENDALTIHPSPPEELQRWWVSNSSAATSARWTAMSPEELPTDAAAYLNAGLIVLNNVPAHALSQVQQQRLMQYVRDLGGGLLILGGAEAFASGGYQGTALEALSPLSSTPPQPTTHWILLADSSGSMAAPAEGGASRWDRAAAAISGVISSLPPHDPVSVGSFARDLRWWSRGEPAEKTGSRAIIPRDVSPHGPTNLQAALESIIASSDASMPTELIVLTDADTKVEVDTISSQLRSKRIRLHTLLTASVLTDNSVHRLCIATGGNVATQSDSNRWLQALRQILRATAAEHYVQESVAVRFVGQASELGDVELSGWNQTWTKPGVEPLMINIANPSHIVAATWQFGAGRVAAIGAAMQSVEGFEKYVATIPQDPRLQVQWRTGVALKVSIDAVENGDYLNALSFTLELRDPSGSQSSPRVHRIPQSSPGRYTLEIPAPRSSQTALVKLGDRIISRRAIAARYAPEFEQIGVNHSVLEDLAHRSGGRIIEPDDNRAIEFNFAKRPSDMTAPMAACGAGLIALGLIWWRLR